MCCNANRRATQNLRRKMIAAGGKMTFWKVISGQNKSSIFYPYTWKVGINKAVFQYGEIPLWYNSWADKNSVVYCDNVKIYTGIHVYINKEQAQSHVGGPDFLLEVECNVKDLVGSERIIDKCYHTTAVFTKVKVTTKAWKKYEKDVKVWQSCG